MIFNSSFTNSPCPRATDPVQSVPRILSTLARLESPSPAYTTPSIRLPSERCDAPVFLGEGIGRSHRATHPASRLRLHKAEPVGVHRFPASVAKERRIRSERQDVPQGDLDFRPLENEDAVFVENAKALGESFSQRLFPVVGQGAVFQRGPRRLPHVYKMWRVEDDELIRFVLEGQAREVAYGIGRYLDVSIRVELVTLYHAVVAVFHVWIVLIEPEHFASARNVKDAFPFVHSGIVPFLYDSFSRSMGESNRQWQVRRLPYSSIPITTTPATGHDVLGVSPIRRLRDPASPSRPLRTPGRIRSLLRSRRPYRASWR